MSAPTTPLVLTTREPRARFAAEVSGRVTIVAALRLASHALFDAGNHETTGTFAQRAFRFVGERLGRWASRREDRLRDEFFPQAVGAPGARGNPRCQSRRTP
jgi:hypothetical protein